MDPRRRILRLSTLSVFETSFIAPPVEFSLANIMMLASRLRFCRLTYNYGREEYDIGTGFGHFGLAVNDVYATSDEVKSKGGIVSREPGPVKGGKTNIAFVKDPTGYSWELIERQGEIPEPIAQVMLRVGDLDKSIKFYTEALGMKLLRTRENPEYKYTLAFLGYGDEQSSTVFELTYNWGKDSSNYGKGDAYAQVAISTKDVFKTAEQIRSAGGTITREPGPVPGIGTKIGSANGCFCFDFYLFNYFHFKGNIFFICSCMHRSRWLEDCLCR